MCSAGVQGFCEGGTAGTFKFIGQKMTARKALKTPGFEKIHSEAKNPYEILERRGIPTTLSQEERAAFDAVGLEMKYKPGSAKEPNLRLNKGNDKCFLRYEKAPYHGSKNNSIKNKAPNMGQEALNNSLPIGPNTTRRVGISDGEIVVFDETTQGVFHGHVRTWDELSEPMKAVLRKAGLVTKKGKIIE